MSNIYHRIRKHIVTDKKFAYRDQDYGGIMRKGSIPTVNYKGAAGVAAAGVGLEAAIGKRKANADAIEPKSGETRGGKRYRIAYPSPTDAPSVDNLPVTGQAMGGRQATDGDEVAVVPPPRKIAKIHPDYFTLNLPYNIVEDVFAASSFTFTNSTPLFTIRLNSLYDPLAQSRAGTLTNPHKQSDVQPQGRDIWAAHFKYYRVLEADIKVTIVNAAIRGSGSFPFFNSFMTGFELTDEDGAIANNLYAFMGTKHAKRKFLKACDRNTYWDETPTASAQNIGTNLVSDTFTFKYIPEAWDYHIEEKGSEERWTPIAQNPAIDHQLNVRLFHIDPTNPPSGNLAAMVSVMYKVQFREPIDSILKNANTETATDS